MLNAISVLVTILWAPMAMLLIPMIVWMGDKKRPLPGVATSAFVLVLLVVTAVAGVWLYVQGGHLMEESSRFVRGDLCARAREYMYMEGNHVQDDSLLVVLTSVSGLWWWGVMLFDRRAGVHTYC